MYGSTRDGRPVELYTLLAPGADPEIVHAAVPVRARTLDLGCAVGGSPLGSIARSNANARPKGGGLTERGLNTEPSGWCDVVKSEARTE